MYMSKKKKFFSLNFFAINKSKKASYHPHYVFGKVGNKYKSFGLTHSPKENHPHHKLNANPNKKDPKTSYIQKEVHTTPSRFIKKILRGWKFEDPEDKAYVQHMKKEYRKSNKKRR